MSRAGLRKFRLSLLPPAAPSAVTSRATCAKAVVDSRERSHRLPRLPTHKRLDWPLGVTRTSLPLQQGRDVSVAGLLLGFTLVELHTLTQCCPWFQAVIKLQHL